LIEFLVGELVVGDNSAGVLPHGAEGKVLGGLSRIPVRIRRLCSAPEMILVKIVPDRVDLLGDPLVPGKDVVRHHACWQLPLLMRSNVKGGDPSCHFLCPCPVPVIGKGGGDRGSLGVLDLGREIICVVGDGPAGHIGGIGEVIA